MERKLREIAQLICSANRTVALTGAGISAESGLPTFRGPSGIWTSDPEAEQRATIDSFLSSPKEYWERIVEGKSFFTAFIAESIKPNPAHIALAELENMGKLSCVITQNVDELHQKAGNKNVIELHGSLSKAKCVQCEALYNFQEVLEEIRKGLIEIPPRCRICNGILKSSGVAFGEPLPRKALKKAQLEALACDVMLVVGSTLLVYPAALLPEIAKNYGAKIVVINLEPAARDDLADYIIYGKAGEILPSVVEMVKEALQR